MRRLAGADLVSDRGEAAAGAPVAAGDLVAGKYRVERVLGQGGMGVVVAARHEQLGERVAIKFLLGSHIGGSAVARFLHEGRTAVRIRSEHVARVFDVGELDSGEPYIVMEHLTGKDLGGVLETRGPLPIAAAVEYVLQACEALAEAHVMGIVHRDLKPSNLFLSRRADGSPVIKVIDFGISKDSGPRPSNAVSPVTKSAEIMGSPLYMSPEQMRSSRDVDARCDIWALGAVLYCLLTGNPPFAAPSMPEVFVLIQAGAPALRASLPGAPAELEAVLLRCLEKEPADRYPTIAELAEALRPFAPANAHASVDRISRIFNLGPVKSERLPFPLDADEDPSAFDSTVEAASPELRHLRRPPPAAERLAGAGEGDRAPTGNGAPAEAAGKTPSSSDDATRTEAPREASWADESSVIARGSGTGTEGAQLLASAPPVESPRRPRLVLMVVAAAIALTATAILIASRFAPPSTSGQEVVSPVRADPAPTTLAATGATAAMPSGAPFITPRPSSTEAAVAVIASTATATATASAGSSALPAAIAGPSSGVAVARPPSKPGPGSAASSAPAATAPPIARPVATPMATPQKPVPGPLDDAN